MRGDQFVRVWNFFSKTVDKKDTSKAILIKQQ